MEHYYGAWIHHRKPGLGTLVDHFYVKKFKEKDFLKIEQAASSSQDWGTEVIVIKLQKLVRNSLHEIVIKKIEIFIDQLS